MKSFSQYHAEHKILDEANVAWLNSASNMIFRSEIMLPLSTPIFKRIFEEIPRHRVFHITDHGSVAQTVKLQNKKKSISAFMSAAPDMLVTGINNGGGVVFEMDADVLVSAPNDIMSQPDKTGRRWIEAFYIPNKKLSAAITEDGSKVLQKLIVKYGGKRTSAADAVKAWKKMDPRRVPDSITGKNKKKPGAGHWTSKMIKSAEMGAGARTRRGAAERKGGPHATEFGSMEPMSASDRRSASLKFIATAKKDPKNRKLLGSMVADYIDGMEGVLKKHASEFRQAFISYHADKTLSNKGYAWDELVVNQIDIKKVHIIYNMSRVALAGNKDDMSIEHQIRDTKNFLNKKRIPHQEWESAEDLSRQINLITGKPGHDI